MMRHAAAKGRPDANHAEIVDAYEELFCSVFDTHGVGLGFPDLVIGCAGVTDLVEIKTADGDLRASQELFITTWRGAKVVVVRTPEDVHAHVKAIRGRFAK